MADGQTPSIWLAKLQYAKDLDQYLQEKPYSILTAYDGCKTQTNLEWEWAEPEEVTDVSGHEQEFTLDDHGFKYIVWPTVFRQWDDRRAVEETYLTEVDELLKCTLPDVDEVAIFDWRRRTSRLTKCREFTDMNNPVDPLGPASQVHLDQAPLGVLKRVRLMMGERAQFLLRGRVQIVNVWRPLATVRNWPLVVCDGSSMKYEDLLETDLIRKDYIGTTMYAKYRPGYKWYFLHQQTPEELCLFKNFDSDRDVGASSR